jgi:hypothetical protein
MIFCSETITHFSSPAFTLLTRKKSSSLWRTVYISVIKEKDPAAIRPDLYLLESSGDSLVVNLYWTNSFNFSNSSMTPVHVKYSWPVLRYCSLLNVLILSVISSEISSRSTIISLLSIVPQSPITLIGYIILYL